MFTLLLWAALLGLPAEWAAPTLSGVIVVVIIVLYKLILDRSAFRELEKRIADQDKEIDKLQTRLNSVEDKYEYQRSLKHQAVGFLAKADLIITIVSDLKANCTCEALLILDPIIDRYMEEMKVREAARVGAVG